jgi:16S rRNA G966 N2-methylase RsmD
VLGLEERAELVRAEVGRWLAGVPEGPAGSCFDLVFVDAPYRLADRVAQDLNTHLPRLLSVEGRAIVESGAGRPLRIDSLARLRQRRYGAADVSIYAGAEK